MKTYVWLTFAFLGWGYYEASGGADFKPGPSGKETAPMMAAEAAPADPAPRQVAQAETRARGSVQRQLETALLTALRDKHPAASSESLQDVRKLAFAAEAQPQQPEAAEEAAVTITSKTISPRLRPDDLTEEAEAEASIALAIGPNTAAAPDASPRPRLRPRELAGAPAGVMPTISTRGDSAAVSPFATGRITASRANMRMGPGTNFPVLRAISGGASVRILRSGPDGWVKLKSEEDGRIGWMAGHLVSRR